MVQAGDCYFLSAHDERLVLVECIDDDNCVHTKLIIRESGDKYIVTPHRINGTLWFQSKRKVNSKIFLKIEKLIKMNYNICSAIISQAHKVSNGECEVNMLDSQMFVTYSNASGNERIVLGYTYIRIRPSYISVYNPTFSKDTYIEIREKTINTIKSTEDLWDTMKTF